MPRLFEVDAYWKVGGLSNKYGNFLQNAAEQYSFISLNPGRHFTCHTFEYDSSGAY